MSRVEIFLKLIIEQERIYEEGDFFFENLVREQGKRTKKEDNK